MILKRKTYSSPEKDEEVRLSKSDKIVSGGTGLLAGIGAKNIAKDVILENSKVSLLDKNGKLIKKVMPKGGKTKAVLVGTGAGLITTGLMLGAAKEDRRKDDIKKKRIREEFARKTRLDDGVYQVHNMSNDSGAVPVGKLKEKNYSYPMLVAIPETERTIRNRRDVNNSVNLTDKGLLDLGEEGVSFLGRDPRDKKYKRVVTVDGEKKLEELGDDDKSVKALKDLKASGKLGKENAKTRRARAYLRDKKINKIALTAGIGLPAGIVAGAVSNSVKKGAIGAAVGSTVGYLGAKAIEKSKKGQVTKYRN